MSDPHHPFEAPTEAAIAAVSTAPPVAPATSSTSGSDASFWQEIVTTAVGPLVVLDPSHRCVLASEAMVDQTGFTVEQLVGRHVATLVVDADGSSVVERLDRTDDAASVSFGVSLATVAGRPAHTRATVSCIGAGDGPRHVVVFQPLSAGTSVESALRRRVGLENLLERVQHRFIHAVPSEIGRVIVWALQEVAEYLGADRGYVLEFDAAARTESMIHEWAAPGIVPELGEYVDVSWDLAPAASRRNNDDMWVSAVPDVSKLDGEWELDRCFFEASGLKSILELPLIVDGRAVGGLGFDWLTDLADWTEDDLTVLGLFASTFAQLLGRDAAEREMVRRANHDELTGLPNRTGVLGRLQEAIDHQVGDPTNVVGVAVIDVDQFKVVNDSLGDTAGDELLRLVAARLRGLVRPNDVVARIGGDEFALVMGDLPDEWAASQMCERIRSALAEPYEFRGHNFRLTVSCGLAIDADGVVTATEMLRRAGAAVYRAKELGRARQTVYDTELERRIAARLELDQQLRRAAERNEFEVHFQPEIELATGRVLGAEALLRWRTDGRLRDAGTFIDVVEETGLIVEVGRFVLDDACCHAAGWCRREDADGFVIRVNLSPRQIEDPRLVEQVAEILDRHELPADRLCLEITETALMSNPEAAMGVLRRLDALGVSLAIDDFGTGYSSLSYLKRFPVDILKIDRSFVDGLPTDADDHAIVSTIIQLAGSLGMSVTAEGIETEGQAAALVALGCDRGQGWRYSKAVPPAELDAMLDAGIVVPAI